MKTTWGKKWGENVIKSSLGLQIAISNLRRALLTRAIEAVLKQQAQALIAQRPMEDGQLRSFEDLQALVMAENLRQLKKWGVQRHTLPEWLMYLGEEVGELNQAAGDYYHGRASRTDKARAEAIQAATLALKIAEMLEAGVSHETGGQDG